MDPFLNSLPLDKMRNDAVSIFQEGLHAVRLQTAMERFCRVQGHILFVDGKEYDLNLFDHIWVVGAGKAGASMASALEQILGTHINGGHITVKYRHTTLLEKITLTEAGHPVPDENGLAGTRRIMEMASAAGENDLVICLISGGGSALLPMPAPGISLADKQAVIQELLSCGAFIHEINTLRKHLSAIKGGHLARLAYPATLISLILSDVVGDDQDVIASGPTVPDKSTFEDCRKIISKYLLEAKLPQSVVSHIEKGSRGNLPETPKPGDPVFEKTQNVIIGSNINALMAAGKKAESLGYHTVILSSQIQGDTSEAGRLHCAIAREILSTGNPVGPPACILSGGETTVKIKGQGLGGRNQEFALVCAFEIADRKNVVVLSAGTDGTDGPTDAAGAIVDSQTLARAKALWIDPESYLANNDSYTFFKQLNDLFITGPTLTNVMDLRVVLVC